VSTTMAWLPLVAAVLCTAAILTDLVRRGAQKMWIMNVVWPVTALWAGPLCLGDPRGPSRYSTLRARANTARRPARRRIKLAGAEGI